MDEIEHEASRWLSVTGSPLALDMPNFRAYGVVFRAQELSSSKIIALKQLRVPQQERQNGVPITALREISILRSLKHENIVNVLEIAVGEEAMDDVYMVMEYCEQVSGSYLPRGNCVGGCARELGRTLAGLCFFLG
ncbi:MAG: hypothetical protein Q9208_008188 [Pyrenodesmia sp. 3 TL-2023]